MDQMTIMVGGLDLHAFIMWGMAIATVLSGGLATFLLLRKSTSNRLPVAGLALERGWQMPGVLKLQKPARVTEAPSDTIFILPDISHYTRFMTGTCFSVSHAQHVIFSLLNAMITAADRTLKFSKLEGDAALFYVDANQLSKEELGQSVMSIFAAFFSELERLKAANVCKCRACRHIDDLDLKIFVHRGKTARFEFRGSVDHFGTDVIVLHRMMKNSLQSSRYLMVTEAASECITLPNELTKYDLDEHVELIGPLRASVYELSDEMIAKLATHEPSLQRTRSNDLLIKVRETLRSLPHSMRRQR